MKAFLVDLVRVVSLLAGVVAIALLLAAALTTPATAEQSTLQQENRTLKILQQMSLVKPAWRDELEKSPALDALYGASRPLPSGGDGSPSITASRVGRDHHLDEHYTVFVKVRGSRVICTVSGDYVVCR